ncbi:glycine cleavage system protein GcvH [Rickettsiella endosymbiont of Miltochrista miniata]|uniref:glycine cleavage system protein GcvH n=1 Tax=Rickettsiella endosymbiont of Miltochrista miniata TaxID=3066239 RepID=UPI00313B1B4E
MKKLPEFLKYTTTHEWLRLEDNNIVCVGITAHAQELLGDIVYVELPAIKKILKQSEEACVLESVKAAADVYAPLSGIVTEINTLLSESPELINADSYGEGWLFRLQFSDANELENLLDFATYEQQILVEA